MTLGSGQIFIVDDDPVMLLVMGRMLQAVGHRVEAFERPEALLGRLSPRDRGCVVVDLRMPGLNGLELQQAFVAREVYLPIIFVSGRADVASAVAAMKRGAVDFLFKPVDPAELREVVDRALRTDAERTSRRLAREQVRSRWAELTPRERDVCHLFAQGLADKQIGAALGTAGSTVQAQRARALQKLRVGSAADLVRLLAHLDDAAQL